MVSFNEIMPPCPSGEGFQRKCGATSTYGNTFGRNPAAQSTDPQLDSGKVNKNMMKKTNREKNNWPGFDKNPDEEKKEEKESL